MCVCVGLWLDVVLVRKGEGGGGGLALLSLLIMLFSRMPSNHPPTAARF